MTSPLYHIADELRAIANMGLRHAANDYDRDRYERVLALSARLVAELDSRDPGEVLAVYRESFNHVSPYIGASAAVFRDKRILLMKRHDNGLWAMPGGLTEVGESWAESALRELREEVGLEGRAVRLLGVFDTRLWGGINKSQVYRGVFEIEVGPDSEPTISAEAVDVGFFAEDGLPPLSPGHIKTVPLVLRQVRGEAAVPYFDTPA